MPYYYQPSTEELAPLPLPLALTGTGRDATSVPQILKEQAMAKNDEYLTEGKKFKLIGWLSGITQSQIDEGQLALPWFMDGAEKAVGEKVHEKAVQKFIRIAGLVPCGPIHANKKHHFSEMAALKDRIARLEHAVFNGNKVAN